MALHIRLVTPCHAGSVTTGFLVKRLKLGLASGMWEVIGGLTSPLAASIVKMQFNSMYAGNVYTVKCDISPTNKLLLVLRLAIVTF